MNNSKDFTNTITEITQLYPIDVDDIYIPGKVTQIQDIIRRTDKSISIGGGRFSMGGQIAHTGSLHIDMRGLNRVVDLDVQNKITVVHIKLKVGCSYSRKAYY